MFLSARDLSKEELSKVFTNLDNYIETNYTEVWTKYLDFGNCTIRLVNYSDEFTHLVKKQLSYVLKDSADKFDATIKIWKEKDIAHLPMKVIDRFNPRNNLNFRLELLRTKKTVEYAKTFIFDENFSKIYPVIQSAKFNKIFQASDFDNKTFYLGVHNLEPEEFIKEGHIFVQQINKSLQLSGANLVHGACIGYDNKGALFCARGQRGKSTLAVLSMIRGFDYVSDDYLSIKKQGNDVVTNPIYSIITLSPKMYNSLYDDLDGCRFLFNNARKDKYVIEISKFHNQFKQNYPVKFCLFPEIVNQKEPSIELCSVEDKARAICQFIQSGVSQTLDINNKKLIKNLVGMIKDFDFYKMNLSPDIEKNTEFLKEFLLKNDFKEKHYTETKRMCVDVTFDIANILDTETGIIYTMNEFATNIFQLLLNGQTCDEITTKLKTIENMPYDISEKVLKIENFINENNLNDNSLLETIELNKDFILKNDYKLIITKYDEDKTEDILK